MFGQCPDCCDLRQIWLIGYFPKMVRSGPPIAIVTGRAVCPGCQQPDVKLKNLDENAGHSLEVHQLPADAIATDLTTG